MEDVMGRSCANCANTGRYLWCKDRTLACTAWAVPAQKLTWSTDTGKRGEEA